MEVNISDLRNLEHQQEVLNSVGIRTKGNLEIFRRLIPSGNYVGFEMVYRIEGALVTTDWEFIPELIVSDILELRQKPVGRRDLETLITSFIK